MARAHLKIHDAATQEILELTGELGRRSVDQIAAGLPEGYEVSHRTGKGKWARRPVSSVFTRTIRARRDNAKNNTLLRNLDRGRF